MEVRLTPEMLDKAFRLHWKDKLFGVTIAIGSLVAGGLGLAALLFLTRRPLVAAAVTLICVMVVALFLLSLGRTRRLATRRLRQANKNYIRIDVQFDRDHLFTSNERGASKVPWGHFRKYYRNKELLLLYVEKGWFHVLPVEQIGEEIATEIIHRIDDAKS